MTGRKDLKITVEEQDGLGIVRVEGQVVRENQFLLRAELERLIGNGTSRIALNLQGVLYMDSAGLGCCAAVQKLLSERGLRAIAVFGASAQLDATWNMIRLDRIIPLFATEEDAVAWLLNPS